MNKYVVEFTLVGEGAIYANTEHEAKQTIKEALEKSASLIGTELADNSELVHISASRLHTLRIVKQIVPPPPGKTESSGEKSQPETSDPDAKPATGESTAEGQGKEKEEATAAVADETEEATAAAGEKKDVPVEQGET